MQTYTFIPSFKIESGITPLSMLPVRNLRRKHKAVRQEQSWKYDNMLYASYSKMFGYEKKKLEKKREETALTC